MGHFHKQNLSRVSEVTTRSLRGVHLSVCMCVQDTGVSTFAMKMRVSATHVVQQVEEFMKAAQKALDTIEEGRNAGDDAKEKLEDKDADANEDDEKNVESIV